MDKWNVFYEHDTGVNLHGLLIAETIDSLFEKLGQVLYADIYGWYEGVNEQGIDLSEPVYKNLLNLKKCPVRKDKL